MHNHDKRGKRFCPLMKEWCTKGWTPAMGFDGDGDDKMPKLGACASWQAVSLVDNKTGVPSEIFDCSVYGWTPDLLTELSGRLGMVTASIDKTANEVAKQHGTIIAMAPEDQKRQLLETDPRRKMLPGHKEAPLPGNLNNGSKNNENK